jgi:hypothetical protein
MSCTKEQPKISFSINRGTTNTLTFTGLSVDFSLFDKVYFTVRQNIGLELINVERAKEDIAFPNENTAEITLTQEEALEFQPQTIVMAQMTGLQGQTRISTEIEYGTVTDVLKDVEI